MPQFMQQSGCFCNHQRELRRYLKAYPRYGGLVISAMGMRASESSARSKLPTWRRNVRNSKARREWFDWLPIHSLETADVFRIIRNAGQSPHWAYAAGMSRLSCSFCILASRSDLRRAPATSHGSSTASQAACSSASPTACASPRSAPWWPNARAASCARSRPPSRRSTPPATVGRCQQPSPGRPYAAPMPAPPTPRQVRPRARTSCNVGAAAPLAPCSRRGAARVRWFAANPVRVNTMVSGNAHNRLPS